MYFINVHLPRINKIAKLREFTNKHCFDLSKFYHNEDIQGINMFFENCIKELLINRDIYWELTCIEKFIILLELYSKCFSETISLYSKSVNSNVDISILTIINKIKDFSVDEKELYINDFKITFNAPTSLYVDNIDRVFEATIYSITNGADIYYYNNFSEKEKDMFLSSLPSYLFDEILNYYNNLSKKVFNTMPENETFQFEPLYLSVTNGAIFTFLRSIYNIDIKNHYNNMLVFCKQFNSNIESFFSLSYKDFIALYKIYESNIKQSEKGLNFPTM